MFGLMGNSAQANRSEGVNGVRLTVPPGEAPTEIDSSADAVGYHVIRKLAQGGMAEIFLARHQSVDGFQRNVVIKRILPEYSQDPEFVGAFLNEAKLSAQLNHPNIIQIYDLGCTDGCYFIAMEYVRGCDLSALIGLYRRQQRHLPLPVVMSLMNDIGQGLQFAHSAKDFADRPLGLVHRDVTPSNVLVAAEGQAKLLDFGIAKAMAMGAGKTKTGVIKGKFAYLAPEQVLGHHVDQRADIFSAGVCFFELLAGRNPFQGPTEYETLMLIAKAELPALLEVRSDLPPAFARVAHKALAANPDERYLTCSDFLADINQVARAESVSYSHQDAADCVRESLPELEAQKQQSISSYDRSDSDLSGKVLRLGGARQGATNFSQAPSKDFISRWKQKSRAWVPVAAFLSVVGLAGTAAVWFGKGRPAPFAAVAVPISDTGFEIVTTPPGSQILLDGVLLTGVTPVSISGLEVGGDHTIEARLKGFSAAQSVINHAQAGMHLVQMSLTSLAAPPLRAPDKVLRSPHLRVAESRPRANEFETKPPEPGGVGRIRVVVVPWATVAIDGKAVGETPIPSLELASGAHTVLIENDELKKTVRRLVTVRTGQETAVREDLTH